MKRIICLIDTLGQGGAERQMAGLAVLLKEKGYDVRLVAYHVEDLYGDIAREGGVEPVILHVNNTSLSKLKAVYKYIKRIGGCDCLISYKSGPNGIGCLLKVMGLKHKLIVSERSFSQSVSRRDKVCFFLYRFANYIVPNSFAQANFIRQNYKNLSSKVVTITNFTDTVKFSPLSSERQNEKFVVLTVARIAKVKNIANYLEAIRLIKQQNTDIHFDWYGDVQSGEEDYFIKIKESVIELGIDDMITFHLATKNISEKYQQCDLFCLPSIYEGFPNVVCEAMSCGKPVICSRVCDLPRIVSEGKNGLLFLPNDINDIYNKIMQIYEMPKGILLEWGRESRRIALEMFSEDAFVEKYIKLIENN